MVVDPCSRSVPPRATLSASVPRQMPSTGSPRRSAARASATSTGSRAELGRPQPRVVVGVAVAARVEVGAAREADAVEAVEQRRRQRRIVVSEHHGQPAGAVDRPQVGHAERHLRQRRLAVTAQGPGRVCAELGRRDADQRPHTGVIVSRRRRWNGPMDRIGAPRSDRLAKLGGRHVARAVRRVAAAVSRVSSASRRSVGRAVVLLRCRRRSRRPRAPRSSTSSRSPGSSSRPARRPSCAQRARRGSRPAARRAWRRRPTRLSKMPSSCWRLCAYSWAST